MNTLLILICVAAFVYELSLENGELVQFFYTYGMVPERVTEALALQRYGEAIVPAITAIFLHGGWLHLLGNMLFLWVFGDNIEDMLGSLGYLVFFLFVGVLANLSHALTTSAVSLPTIGASGAVAGVLGAYLISFPRSKVLTLLFLGFLVTLVEIPAIFFLLYWFFLQLVYGVASLGVDTAASSGVAWWAHIGGFVAGAISVTFFRRTKVR